MAEVEEKEAEEEDAKVEEDIAFAFASARLLHESSGARVDCFLLGKQLDAIACLNELQIL